jgi:hypothetical protein
VPHLPGSPCSPTVNADLTALLVETIAVLKEKTRSLAALSLQEATLHKTSCSNLRDPHMWGAPVLSAPAPVGVAPPSPPARRVVPEFAPLPPPFSLEQPRSSFVSSSGSSDDGCESDLEQQQCASPVWLSRSALAAANKSSKSSRNNSWDSNSSTLSYGDAITHTAVAAAAAAGGAKSSATRRGSTFACNDDDASSPLVQWFLVNIDNPYPT